VWCSNYGVQETSEEGPPRKRARVLGSVRQFSRKLSSALSSRRPGEPGSEPSAIRPPSALKVFAEAGKGALQRATSTRAKGRASRIFSASTPEPRLAVSAAAANDRPDYLLDIAFVGDASIGKTALIHRLVNRGFTGEYEPNGLAKYSARLTLDGIIKIGVDLHDAGSLRSPEAPHPLKSAWFQVVVFCFDITDQGTLANLHTFYHSAMLHAEGAVFVMAGLKSDRRRAVPSLHLSFLEEPDQVLESDGRAKAHELRCVEYFECSAKSGEKVKELLDFAIRAGVQKRKDDEKRFAPWRREHQREEAVAKVEDRFKSILCLHPKEERKPGADT